MHIADSATPSKKAKPVDASAAQVFAYFGETMPVDNEQFHFIGLATRSTFPIDLQSNQCGNGSFFRLRWVNSKGETGPWGDIIVG